MKRRAFIEILGGAVASPLWAKAQQPARLPTIEFFSAGDPLGLRLVASLARPGGNITDLSNQQTDLGTKGPEFLREIIPDIHRVAVMANAPGAVRELVDVQATARILGLEVVTLEIRST